MAASVAQAQTLDTVVFGDSGSETAHGFNTQLSSGQSGALGQPTRRMFRNPSDANGEGGYLGFTAKCDPYADNFVTLKIWGGDYNQTASGMLMLYMMEGGTQLQVGYIDQQVGEYSPLAWGYVDTPPAPGRFFYTTIPLPLSMTQGRTSVTLRVIGTGMNDKGSLPVYRASVHTGSYFEPGAGDPQAPPAPPAPIRPAGTVGLQQALNEAKAQSNSDVANWIANGGGDPDQLGLAYKTPWSIGYNNPAALTRAADIFTPSLDASCQSYFQNPGNAGSDWGGIYGRQGDMIATATAAGFGSRLDQVIDLGDPAGPATRRVLWAKMLKASRDAGRFSRQGPTSAQSLIGDNNIYRANRGLLVLGSSDALTESQALRYPLEASGLLPWLGSDRVDGTHDSYMGTNYYELTPEGMTKENGYVSAYGESYSSIAGYYTYSGDTRFRDRVNQVFKTRSYFKYIMVDSQGYRCSQLVGPLDWRHQQEMPVNVNYGETGTRLSVAAATGDPYAVAIARQMIEDNQGPATWGKDIYNAILLDTLVNTPATGQKLPMTEGQPDFAWADVDNGVVAIKRGEECTWIEPFWQSRTGLHATGRVLQITPTAARVGYVRNDLQLKWNQVWHPTADGLSWDGSPQNRLYGTVHQAYANEKLVNNSGPADASGGAQSTREEFIGRASFYSCRYGRYLVGINMDKNNSYVLKTPPGFTSAQDLITKTTKSGAITLGPVSAVVLDMGTNIEATALPRSGRYIAANGVVGGVSVMWDAMGGATTYTLKRATTSGGPYTTIASGLGGVYPKKWGNWAFGTHVDTTAVNGTAYYYIVAGVNNNGEGYPSPQSAGATPSTAASVNSLPAPTANVNFSAGGSAAYNSTTGVYSLIGGGGDFWNSSDGGHFVYRPMSGDGALIARLTNTGGAYKCGLAIRQNLGANSINVSLSYQNGSVGAFRRDGNGSGMEYVAGGASGLTLPVWLKLEHKGKTTLLSCAPDVSGAPGTWNTFSSWSNEIGGTSWVGLYTTSGNPTTFDNVTWPLYGARVPTAPGSLTATSGNARVSLAWAPADQATTYGVYRSTTSGGPYSTTVATGLTAASYTDTTAVNGTAYFYVVRAINVVGNSPDSAQASATPRATAPTPTNLTVAVTGTQAVLNWTASSGATGYTVLRSLDGVTWTTIASGVTATTYTNTGLTAGQAYYYSIQATNGNGASESTASAIGTAAPEVPLLRTADASVNQGVLRWNTSGAATSYNVWRATTLGGTYTKVANNLTSAAYVDGGLTTNADYFYKISAVNAAGESAQSSALKLGWGTGLLGSYYNSTDFSGAAQFNRLDPAIVFDWGNGSPAPGMNNDFSVRWTGQIEAPTTDTYTFTGYADDSLQAFVNGTQVVNNGTINLVGGQKYTFVVEFRDTGGAAYFNLFWSTPSIAQQNLPSSRLYPSVPAKLRSSGGTATASTSGGGEGPANAFDGNAGSKWSNGITGAGSWLQYQFASGATWAVSEYRLTSANDVPERDPKDWLFQGSNDGTNWTTLDTRTGQSFTGRNQTNYYPIANPTAYAYYRLNVSANLGGSGYGVQLSEFTLLSPNPLAAAPVTLTAVAGDKQATLTWPAVTGATAYNVKRSIYNGGPYASVARVTSGTSLVDTNLVNGTRYYYAVSTVSAEGEGTNSPQATVLVAPVPAAPTGLSATPGNALVNLQWTASAWATSYTVKRSTTSGSGYANIASGVTGAAYTDGGLTNGTTYYYVVSATNGTGTSANSTQASATLTSAAIATASVNTSSASEVASMAFDGKTNTKWCEGAFGASGWLQYQFANGISKTIASYAITSANDVPQRDPSAWQLQGSTNGTTWVTLDTQTGQTFASRLLTKLYPIASPAAYSYYRFNITAISGGGASGVQIAELALIPTLTSPWSTADIGTVGVAGAAGASGGAFTAVGSGSDIAGTSDSFRYVYQTASGDCSITARVTSVQNTNALAKAGVMIRETLNADAIHITCDITPNASNEAISRIATAASSTATSASGAAAPYWVRLVRSGNTFTASRSADGVTWTVTSTQVVTMAANVTVGFVDCSRANSALSLVGFDNVTAVP